MAQVHKPSRADQSVLSQKKLEAIRKSKIVAKKYKCDQCDFRGHSKATIRNHSVVHTGEKPFQCTFPGCSYRAGWKHSLQKHLLTHNPDRDKFLVHHCDQCDYRAATRSQIKNHVTVHSEKKPFACDHPSCNFRTRVRRNLERHKQVKHEKDCEKLEIYSCDQCHYHSKLKWNLANHVKTHSSDKPYACEFSLCNFRCRLAWNLKLHLRRYHDPSQTFLLSCKFPGCLYKTIERSQLNSHLETHDPNRVPKFLCTLCSKGFLAKQSLEKHVVQTHTGEESFSCKLCKFSSKYDIALKKHIMETHSLENKGPKIQKKYKCGYCSYSSIWKCRLIVHERTHTGDKPFACSNCSFRTSVKSNLKQHMKKIHGPRRRKIIECPICSVKFVDIHGMKRHMTVLHSDGPQITFRCHLCDWHTKHEGNLNKHLRKKHHSGNTEELTSDSQLVKKEGKFKRISKAFQAPY